MDIRIEGRGMDVLMERMERLAAFSRSRKLRAALAEAADLVADTARDNLGQRLKGTGRGNLMRSIDARVKRRKAGALAGFVRSSRYAMTGGNHAHLVDLGTRQRPGRGAMPANYFWTDAVAATYGRAMKLVQDGAKAAMDEAMLRQ